MVQVVFIEPDGERREVDLKEGRSFMEGALRADVDGIVAECGGQCNCGTCHVYVEEARYADLPPPADDEEAMLEMVAAERRPNSRLSCQLKVREDLAGIVLSVPNDQY